MTSQLELATMKRDWVEASIPRVIEFARDAGEFGSDDLHFVLTVPPHVNWFGILFAVMKAKHMIVETGYRASRTIAANGRKITTWRLA